MSTATAVKEDLADGHRFQSRAFLILPMCANIGVIIGPMIGGLTSDPAGNYPSLFGGIRWLEKFPYSPPNLISAMFLWAAVLAVFFGLEEVRNHHQLQNITNISRRIKASITKKTSVSGQAKKSARSFDEFLGNTLAPMATFPSPLTIQILLNSHLRHPPNLENEYRHNTRTGFHSGESLLITLSAPSSPTASWPVPWEPSNQYGTPSSQRLSTTQPKPHRAMHPTRPSYSPVALVSHRAL